ncbi:hypothetical protein [Vibrio phage BONAISHI]|nr:hypothetical protein [Vibrio phage BONAISHI]
MNLFKWRNKEKPVLREASARATIGYLSLMTDPDFVTIDKIIDTIGMPEIIYYDHHEPSWHEESYQHGKIKVDGIDRQVAYINWNEAIENNGLGDLYATDPDFVHSLFLNMIYIDQRNTGTILPCYPASIAAHDLLRTKLWETIGPVLALPCYNDEDEHIVLTSDFAHVYDPMEFAGSVLYPDVYNWSRKVIGKHYVIKEQDKIKVKEIPVFKDWKDPLSLFVAHMPPASFKLLPAQVPTLSIHKGELGYRPALSENAQFGAIVANKEDYFITLEKESLLLEEGFIYSEVPNSDLKKTTVEELEATRRAAGKDVVELIKQQFDHDSGQGIIITTRDGLRYPYCRLEVRYEIAGDNIAHVEDIVVFDNKETKIISPFEIASIAPAKII